ncbi:beta-lactamase hydrolase domain-containing protein [Sphingomonas parva]|nr:sulfur transferase domain-containing protein [Sphingomonas parva]
MTDRIRISDKVIVGKVPPAEGDLKSLALEGFAAVVNLRRAGEPNQTLTPEEEGEAAARYGLRYVHIPVDLANIDEGTIQRFKDEIGQLPGPVFVHCASGRRAEAVASAAERE